jgi:hypothetical protein
MAAFTGTPTKSTQYAAATSGRGGPIAATGLNASVFQYTHAAGAGTGEVNLLVLPAGRLLVFSQLSRVESALMTTNADLHLGFRAYVEPDGDAVAEDDNAFLDNGDAGAAISSVWLLPAVTATDGPGVLSVNVQRSTAAGYTDKGFVVYAMIDTANINDGNTIRGYCVWAAPGA